MPSFVEIGQPGPEKIFEGFLPYMGMATILVIGLDYLYTHWFPLPIFASYKIQAVSEEIFEIVDGRTPDHGSPCEPSAQVSYK